MNTNQDVPTGDLQMNFRFRNCVRASVSHEAPCGAGSLDLLKRAAHRVEPPRKLAKATTHDQDSPEGDLHLNFRPRDCVRASVSQEAPRGIYN
jgi:hypothetical protein